jgi:hypothetical protein
LEEEVAPVKIAVLETYKVSEGLAYQRDQEDDGTHLEAASSFGSSERIRGLSKDARRLAPRLELVRLEVGTRILEQDESVELRRGKDV